MRESRTYGRLKEPSETFVSSKYDFSPGNWAEVNSIFIPSLNMTVSQAIGSLKKNWHMYRTCLSRGEPTDKYSKIILTLQSALGLEQTPWLKDELLSMGYTLAEIEDGEGEGQDDSDIETDSEWSDEDKQLLAEEAREAKEKNDACESEGEESENQEGKEWTDLDQRMYQEELDKKWQVPW